MGYEQPQHPQQHQQPQQQPIYHAPQQDSFHHIQPDTYHQQPHQQVHQEPVHQPQIHQQQAYQAPQTQVYAQSHLVHNQKWRNGICNCSPCTSCLLAFCLPCMLFGRTQSRLRDPTMASHSDMNRECALWCGIQCFTGCGWIYTMLKRAEIREQYGIEGGGMSDCCTTYWCGCCALIQQDNEVKARVGSGPITQGYQEQKQGMHMPASPPAQQQQHQPPAYQNGQVHTAV